MVVPQRRVPGPRLVRARGMQRFEQDVLVVSIDRLTDVMRSVAGVQDPRRTYAETPGSA